MVSITTQTLMLPAAPGIGENPLPKLRERSFDKPLKDAGLLAHQQEGFCYSTGRRLLPCRDQDTYSRERTECGIPAIVLENECLKATFLPGFGGRLYSLFDKRENRELLFKNPVLQLANLAVLGAWFSGGVEWNLGQYGHSSLSCAPVYFARCTAPDGREFLRMYEYERIKGLFLQLDFHLLENDAHLFVHASLQNPHDAPRSFYWWTNTAAVLDENTRVLSGGKGVIATWPKDGENVYMYDEMPHLEMLPGDDASYPTRFTFSAEYFYQNAPKPEEVWETAAYGDGHMLYERSTLEMPYRKMFCWANSTAGNNWQDLLSHPGAERYVEIQSGFCPTQVHGKDLAAHAATGFTQVFGACAADAAALHGTDFAAAVAYTHTQVEQAMPFAALEKLDALFRTLSAAPCGEVLHEGSGWALAEEARRPGFIPASMRFSMAPGSAEAAWAAFAKGGPVPAFVNGAPASFETAPEWLPLLEAAHAKDLNDLLASFHLALALHENGQFARAEALLATAAKKSNLPIVWRTLAALQNGGGHPDAAAASMAAAFAAADTAGTALSPPYYAEYLAFLAAARRHVDAWNLYAAAPEGIRRDDRVRLAVANSASILEQDSFLEDLFTNRPANIREGEIVLSEMWYQKRAREIARATSLSPEAALAEARRESLPAHVDFRMAP